MSNPSDRRLHAPRYAIHAAGGLLALLLASVGWCLVEQPIATHQRTLAEQIEQAFHLAGSATELRQSHGSLREELSEVSTRIEGLETRLAAASHPAQLFEQLTALAQRTKVGVHDYRPGHVQDAGTVRQHTVQLCLSGDYEDLCRFLVELEDQSLLCRISQIKIGGAGGQASALNMDLGLHWSAALQPVTPTSGGSAQ
jgi:Tfp pilus assembly protein PilO